MWRAKGELEQLNADVLVVSFEPMERVRWYLEDVDFGWPVLADPGRTLYAAYGLRRGSVARVWLSPRTLAFYARELIRGRLPRRPAGDTLQLGGDFVIDGEGVLRFAHSSVEPADRPPVAELLAVLAGDRA